MNVPFIESQLTLFLKNNENLLNAAYKVGKVLELICEKEMKASNTNDVLAVKMHYLSSIVRTCHKWNMEKQDGVNDFVKLWVHFWFEFCRISAETPLCAVSARRGRKYLLS